MELVAPPSALPISCALTGAVLDHLRQAVTAFRAGQARAMADACRAALAIQPTSPEALQLMGVAQHLLGEHEQALAWLDRAAAVKPDAADLHVNRGEVLRTLTRWPEAEAALRRAIELLPDNVEAWNNLGLVLQARGRHADAQTAYDHALALKPGHLEATNNLGTLHQELRRPVEAEACYRAVLATRPEHVNALNNLGTLLKEAGRTDEAVALYRRVLEIDPSFHRSWNSLGQLAKERGDHEEAMRCYRRSLELAPGNADTLYNIALADLLFGHLKRGFAGYEIRYHPRSQNKSAPRPPSLGCPMWQGEPLAGKHIALVREQGLGDQLQFCRYAAQLRDAGAEVTLIVDGPLVALMRSLDGPTRVIAPGEMHAHRYDCWAFLLSLPHRLGTDAGQVPADVPYLHAPADKAQAWRTRLARPPGVRATVGLVWGGNKDHANNRNRSARLQTLAPLLDLPGLRFVSLQKGEPAEELRASPWREQVLDLDAELNDYTDTAAAMEAIDLLISVDTSVVHLAGAMDKPCWVMVAHGPDWRWQRQGEDTAWYPSLKLIRQRAPQDWDGVVETIRQRLSHWSPQTRTATPVLQRAMAALNSGQEAAAEALCREALALDEHAIDGWHLLALAHKRQQRFAESLAAFERALALAQESAFRAVILANRGNTEQAAGDLDAAVRSYLGSIELAPREGNTWCALGQALAAQGRHDEAEAAWRDGLAQGAAPAGLLNLLAAAAQRLGRRDEAESLFQQSLQHTASAPTEYNLANLYNDAGRHAEAIAHYRAALALDPHYTLAQTSLLRALQAAGDFAGARGATATVIAAVDAGGDDPLAGPAQPVFPFAFLALPATREQQRRCARQWVARQYAGPLARAPHMRYAPAPARVAGDQRLRIGYLSSDLHAHATAYLMAEVFERHDRQRVEVSAYSCGPDDGSPMRARLMQAVDRFVECSALGLEDLARRIHADGIDILVDLKGYTRDTRSGVLALRPAPVQVNFLGYPGTLGHAFADYVIGDAIVTPLAHAADYDERIAQLPHCYQPNDRQRAVGPAPTRSEAGLPDEAVVLACFNYSYKITEEVFDRWCRILARVPDAVLWLLRSNPLAEANLKREMQSRGVEPARLHFAPELPLAQHLGRLQLADLVLDTEPYNAHTTCSDALWVGVPVLTRTGDTFPSRVATSLLHAAGVPELATGSAETYVELAVALATNPDRLSALKQRLQSQRLSVPLFDSAAWTRELEDLFERMAWRHRHSLAPAALAAVRAQWPSTSIERAFALYQAGAADDEAIAYAQAALREEPQRPDGWTLLGILLKRAGRLDDAEAAYRRALEIAPAYPDAWNNLGNLRRDREDREGALAAYREAVRLNPGNAETVHNLGVALEHFGQWDEALAAFDATVQADPKHVDGHWNRALGLLLHGRFREGFTDYEWRFERHQPEPRGCPQPVWDGTPQPGRTLLVWAEQGFGDAMQFLRFLPEVKRRAGADCRVVVEVLGEMMGLVARTPGVDAVSQRGAQPVAFDTHVALMSLPHVLDVADDALPTLVPYVHADAGACTRWRERLLAHGWQRERELAVGWVWAGNPNVKNDAQRSPRFAPFAPWLRLPGLRWFALQKGDGRRDLAARTLPSNFIDLDSEIRTFDDTAAVIAELDLVITSDTSVAHLAGAMGKPVFVTLPWHHDWRWGLHADRSDWYPSARLFRQSTRGDWSGVRDAVAAALGEWARRTLPRDALQPVDSDALIQRAFAIYQSPAFEAGQAHADAVAALQRAPRRADAWALLGAIQRRAGQPVRAAEAYRRAIDVEPRYHDAWRNLAGLHKARGEMGEALRLLDEALRLAPHDALALSQRSDLHRQQGRFDAAIGDAEAALADRPTLAEAALHLGNALIDAGRFADAQGAFERALSLQPAWLEATFNLGIACQRDDRPADAVPHFEAVLATEPAHERGRYSLGLALQAAGRPAEALAHYEALLQRRPEHFAARFNLAAVHLALGRHADALAAFEVCQQLQPAHAGVALQIVHLRQQLCDWAALPGDAGLRELVQRLGSDPPAEVSAFDAPSPFSLLSLPLELSDADMAPIAQRHARLIASRAGAPLPPVKTVDKPRLRLAYASADFHNHATMHLMRGVFARHSRKRFELSAWSFGADDGSDYRRDLERDVDRLHDVSRLGDRAVAQAMREAGIDILVDLKGYTRDARPGVFSLKPAPLQLTWLGYPGTSGAGWFDAVIGDAMVTPDAAQPAFAEPIANLPHSYQCTDDKQPIAATGITRASVGLPEDAVVLACFCTHYKLDAGLFALWMHLMRSEARTVLWLVEGNAVAQTRLRAAALAAGVAPERLVFAPVWSKDRHLERLALADLVLDTRFYNGHTTVSDALWAGVPVLTLQGAAFAGRVGASLLQAAGLPQGITHSVADYESLAGRLIAQPELRNAWRQQLRDARGHCPLFDTGRFVTDLEALIERLWAAKLASQSPA